MKIHGYADEGRPIEDIVPADLAEITLVATPDELRRIAKFLESCANGMETRGNGWEHEHLSDMVEKAQRAPGTNDLEIATLKKQKMKIKEEIERLSHA